MNFKQKIVYIVIMLITGLNLFGIGGGFIENWILYCTLGLFGILSYPLFLILCKDILKKSKDKKAVCFIYKIIPGSFAIMGFIEVFNIGVQKYDFSKCFIYAIERNLSGGIVGWLISNILLKLFGFSGSIILYLLIIIINCILVFKEDIKQLPLYKKILNKYNKKENIKPKVDNSNINITTSIKEVKQNIISDTLVKKNKIINVMVSDEDIIDIENKKQLLESTLNSFKIKCKVVNCINGLNIIRFDISLGVGTKVSKVMNHVDDISLALSSNGKVRMYHIPGTSTIGIEVARSKRKIVDFSELIQEYFKLNNNDSLYTMIGKNISGKNIFCDIINAPHMLIAGATGSGKSVMINSIICSLIIKYSPSELNIFMIDPKVVELSSYNGIPHLKEKVITKPEEAIIILEKVVNEMNKRYNIFSKEAENCGKAIRKIEVYNKVVEESKQIPRLLIIIDELADLMMTGDNKKVEDLICRIAQLGRAAGIHLIIATQRPSVDVITGVIKANIPTRIAFTVASQVDSRTILDVGGAEKLLGQGDMLYFSTGSSLERIQGVFIEDDNIENVITRIKKEYKNLTLFDNIKKDILKDNSITITNVQTKYKIGFNKAKNIMDEIRRVLINENKKNYVNKNK